MNRVPTPRRPGRESRDWRPNQFREPDPANALLACWTGLFESPWGKHPRLQLLTVGELLEGKQIDYPQTAGINRTYRQAPRARKVAEKARGLFDKDEDPAD